MNKKAYNKPEIRERERIIVTTMICATPVLQIKRKKTSSGDAEEIDEQASMWDAWRAD